MLRQTTAIDPGSELPWLGRVGAAVALGYRGRAAAAPKPQVAQALKMAQDEREQRLLKWCLRATEPGPAQQ